MMRAIGRRALQSASIAAFAAHAGLIAFSTAAMLTILNGPPGAWLESEPTATVMRVAWKFSGPTYVTLGAIAAVLHAGWAFGARRAALLFVAAVGIALGAELLGTSTGFPFGGYAYTSLLGYRILGLVPFPIPISWFYMLYCALALCARLLPARGDARTRWLWAAAAAAFLTAWDVAMDPAMVRTSHWIWRESGGFYGMPLTNWLGWFGSGLVIARVMIAITPPTLVAERNAREWLPVALYAANGVMPIAICLRDGLWWAAALGAVAMATPLVLAVRARSRTGALEDDRPVLAAT
ncbi:MAG TPA: carotenoid biosynthesis protein [Gemmatimonadaceae bacterium]|nr:carotenoid biosynthesis protein [Gemmatimonadaceae bacterium]